MPLTPPHAALSHTHLTPAHETCHLLPGRTGRQAAAQWGHFQECRLCVQGGHCPACIALTGVNKEGRGRQARAGRGARGGVIGRTEQGWPWQRGRARGPGTAELPGQAGRQWWLGWEATGLSQPRKWASKRNRRWEGGPSKTLRGSSTKAGDPVPTYPALC